MFFEKPHLKKKSLKLLTLYVFLEKNIWTERITVLTKIYIRFPDAPHLHTYGRHTAFYCMFHLKSLHKNTSLYHLHVCSGLHPSCVPNRGNRRSLKVDHRVPCWGVKWLKGGLRWILLYTNCTVASNAYSGHSAILVIGLAACQYSNLGRTVNMLIGVVSYSNRIKI